MGDKSFDLVVGEFVAVTFHLFFSTLFDAFLDGLKGFGVISLGLNFGISIILGPGLAAHAGLSFAIGAVTFGAFLLVVNFGIGRDNGGRAQQS